MEDKGMSTPVPLDVSALLKPGVFTLSLHGRVVYVGKAKRLLSALNIHENRRFNPHLPKSLRVAGFDYDAIEVFPCDVITASAYANALIDHYNPIHNRMPRPRCPTVLAPNPDGTAPTIRRSP